MIFLPKRYICSTFLLNLLRNKSKIRPLRPKISQNRIKKFLKINKNFTILYIFLTKNRTFCTLCATFLPQTKSRRNPIARKKSLADGKIFKFFEEFLPQASQRHPRKRERGRAANRPLPFLFSWESLHFLSWVARNSSFCPLSQSTL